MDCSEKGYDKAQPFPFQNNLSASRSSLEKSYNISKEPLQIETKFLRFFLRSSCALKDHGLNPLDAIWDTKKLREAMKDDEA